MTGAYSRTGFRDVDDLRAHLYRMVDDNLRKLQSDLLTRGAIDPDDFEDLDAFIEQARAEARAEMDQRIVTVTQRLSGVLTCSRQPRCVL